MGEWRSLVQSDEQATVEKREEGGKEKKNREASV